MLKLERWTTVVWTAAAMIAFAANSVLCRLALANELISPANFTVIRLCSGALTLTLLLWFKQSAKSSGSQGSWFGGTLLFIYAASFSFAYITLDTASGALILFGSVQVAVILATYLSGEKINSGAFIGVLVALMGFTWLLVPDATRPDPVGVILMVISGLAWSGYTLAGKHVDSPLVSTASNFVRAAILSLLILSWFLDLEGLNSLGVTLAMASGALASGVGYAIWYATVKYLTKLSAGIVQLSVPVIAASGGAIFVGEKILVSFVLACTLTLLGIGLVIYFSSTEEK